MQLRTALPLLVLISIIAACGKSGGGAADSTRVTQDSLVEGVPADLERGTGPEALVQRFAKGDAFGYSIKSVQDVTIKNDTVAEQSMQTVEYRYRFDVLESRADGSARVRATCLGVRFDGEYSGTGSKRTMHYDSKETNDASKEKMFMQYAAPLGTPYEAILTPQGKVESVSGTDAVIDRLLGSDKKTIAAEGVRRIAADYSENGLKNVLQQAFQKLPEYKVATDSTWTHTWAGSLGFLKLQNDAVYTMKGFQKTPLGRSAVITATMTSRYMGGKRIETGQGMATVDKFNVRGSGLTLFNVDTGRPATRKITQKVSAKFFIEPPAELKQAAPDQARDFWWSQEATIESVVSTITL